MIHSQNLVCVCVCISLTQVVKSWRHKDPEIQVGGSNTPDAICP